MNESKLQFNVELTDFLEANEYHLEREKKSDELNHIKELEEENSKLKGMCANLALDLEAAIEKGYLYITSYKAQV